MNLTITYKIYLLSLILKICKPYNNDKSITADLLLTRLYISTQQTIHSDTNVTTLLNIDIIKILRNSTPFMYKLTSIMLTAITNNVC